MSRSILHLELVPPDEWKTVSPCVQKTVISAGSDRLKKRTAVCLQTQPTLAGCSLLSVCRSSTYLSQCDTASATAKLAQSTRFSVSPNSIRFPLNAANSTLNWQEKPQLRWKLHLRNETLWDFFLWAATTKMLAELVCISGTKGLTCAWGYKLKKPVCAGLKHQLQITTRAHLRNTQTNSNKAKNRSGPSDGLAISERQIEMLQLQHHMPTLFELRFF